MSSETHNISKKARPNKTTMDGVTFTKGREPTLLYWDEPLGTLITDEELKSLTADDLRAAIVLYGLDVFRHPDGTYGLWDLMKGGEYVVVPQNTPDSPSAPRGCREAAPASDAAHR
jgi:hypothetical protein